MDESVTDNFWRFVIDPVHNGVPELHFRFWRAGDERARESYLERFRADAAAMAWFEEGFLGDDPDFDELLAMREGTLGCEYARHIVDNGLSRTLARDYRTAHEGLAAAGKLDGMPVEVQYATVRGFQIHDLFHVVTGYRTDGWGEMALQAFTLAQRQLPYSAMWMAGLTTQMTFLRPGMTVPVMDAISHGWQLGRAAKPLTYTKWEHLFDVPVVQLRLAYDIPPPGAGKAASSA
jgi:ubiquinone biosynthesis protein COQ4